MTKPFLLQNFSPKYFSAILIALLPAIAVAQAPPVNDRGALLAEIERVDQVVQRLLVRVAINAENGTPFQRQSAEAEHLDRRIQNLEAAAARLDDPLVENDDPLVENKVAQLRALAGNLRLPANAGIAPPFLSRQPQSVPVGPEAGGAPSNDACANATVINLGESLVGTTTDATRDGEASCGSSILTPDIWFQYTATEDQTVYPDTFGSSYDTVLSIHTGCPGTIDNQHTCNDDTYGLQSAAAVDLDNGETIWIRVSGVNGATGPVQMHLGHGHRIEGHVSDAVSNNPLSCSIAVYDENDSFVASGASDSSGNYSVVVGESPGPHFVKNQGCSGYQAEIYDNIPCIGYYCSASIGTPVEIPIHSTATGIDFELEPFSFIQGTVTAAGSDTPIQSARVRIYSSTGVYVEDDYTDNFGNYEVGGLVAGDYYVTASHKSYFDELYLDLPCPGGHSDACNILDGDPVTIPEGGNVVGLDFSLEKRATIQGTVTIAETGEPVSLYSTDLYLYRGNGSYFGSAETETGGTYEIGGLSDGTYFLIARHYNYAPEMYDSILCPNGDRFDCVPTNGTPLVILNGQSLTGVDFSLEKMPEIGGRVTSQRTGNPVVNARVNVYKAGNGSYWDYTWTDSSGDYLFEGMDVDNYTLTAAPTSPQSTLLTELHDDIPCPGGLPFGCSPNNAEIVAAVLATTKTVDFPLNAGSAVKGTITNTFSLLPIAGAQVQAWNAEGFELGSDTTDENGDYTLLRLPGDTVYVTAVHPEYLDELYSGMACPEAGCDLTAGTPVAVDPDAPANGIDFDLSRLGSLSGQVTHAPSGAPVLNHRVFAYNSVGDFVGQATTDEMGNYELTSLHPGNYYLRSSDGSGGPVFLDEIYPDIPCYDSGCPVLSGQPIAVALNNAVSDIDFALDVYGKISGSVTSSTNDQNIWVDIRLYDENGAFVDSDYASLFSIERLMPGTYYLVATDFDYTNEVYDDLPCAGPCVPTDGTPITIDLNETINGLHFSLDPNGYISGIVTNADGEPILDAMAIAYDASGTPQRTAYTNSQGHYTLDNIASNVPTYVRISAYGYRSEVYDNIPCLNCDPTKGKAIIVRPGATTRHVNFTLEPTDTTPANTGIRGLVTDHQGQPLVNVVVDIWRDSGSYYQSTTTGLDGTYQTNLFTGIWYVSTDNGQGLIDQVYGGVTCPGPAYSQLCDPMSGTPLILESSGDLIENVDFTLMPGAVFDDGFESGNTCLWSSGCQ